MIYPYTIIGKDKVEEFYELLKFFGYTASFDLKRFKTIVAPYAKVYVVIDDCNRFGNFWFYHEGGMNARIKRYFEEPSKFLKLAAQFKGCTEY